MSRREGRGNETGFLIWGKDSISPRSNSLPPNHPSHFKKKEHAISPNSIHSSPDQGPVIPCKQADGIIQSDATILFKGTNKNNYDFEKSVQTYEVPPTTGNKKILHLQDQSNQHGESIIVLLLLTGSHRVYLLSPLSTTVYAPTSIIIFY